MTTVTERVAAGAAYLDEHDPDWWRVDVPYAIELGDLDLESGRLCILGQRCPIEVANRADSGALWFEAYAMHLSGADNRPAVDQWAVPLGFQAIQDDDDAEVTDLDYRALTAEWRRVIEARRAS